MILQDNPIAWVDTFKYLGVVFKSGKAIKVDIDLIKRKFYASCYSIFGKTAQVDELTRLYLIETNCLPLLTYALPALALSLDNINDLNVAWNNIYRKIFGFNKWDSVKTFIAGLGNLDFKHIRLKMCVSFVKDNLSSDNVTFRYVLFRHYVSHFPDLWKKYAPSSACPKLHSGNVSHRCITKSILGIFSKSILI